MNKSELIKKCIDNGILISPSLLDNLKTDNINKLFLTGKFPENLPLVINEDSLLQPDKKKIAANNQLSVNDSYEIISNYKEKTSRHTVKEFIYFYRRRYKAVLKLLKNHSEIQNLTSIYRIKKMNSNERVTLVGMIIKKSLSKNNNFFLEVEDQTADIKVIVSNRNKDAFSLTEDLSLDEVVGFCGNLSEDKKVIFCDKIVLPDIPINNELKKATKEEYALFLGDIHIGSKAFMKKEFLTFLKWINGKIGSFEQKKMSEKIKYLFLVGDLVDGIGIYPGQDEDLYETDILKQYEELAAYLKKIPENINVFVCAGNHDAVRLPEPQPILDKDLAAPIYDLSNVTVVSNPAWITIAKESGFPGIKVLLYHGFSFPYFADTIENIRLNGGLERTDLIMQYLLQRRHLAPTHGSTQYIPSYKQDPLLINTVPDIFATGHVHRATIKNYKGITLLNCSCWMTQTEYQEKVGLKPQPARVILTNLQTRQSKMIKFT
ncbi:DNA-directed DNA polymerase II small subunit [Candidatus Woesearchaeota archaeon]|nr:DNA-directed DNA polymerase II small subunit [Candidatus Woesearchaeota archaeon]